jgi:hypothetical protein
LELAATTPIEGDPDHRPQRIGAGDQLKPESQHGSLLRDSSGLSDEKQNLRSESTPITSGSLIRSYWRG